MEPAPADDVGDDGTDAWVDCDGSDEEVVGRPGAPPGCAAGPAAGQGPKHATSPSSSRSAADSGAQCVDPALQGFTRQGVRAIAEPSADECGKTECSAPGVFKVGALRAAMCVLESGGRAGILMEKDPGWAQPEGRAANDPGQHRWLVSWSEPHQDDAYEDTVAAHVLARDCCGAPPAAMLAAVHAESRVAVVWDDGKAYEGKVTSVLPAERTEGGKVVWKFSVLYDDGDYESRALSRKEFKAAHRLFLEREAKRSFADPATPSLPLPPQEALLRQGAKRPAAGGRPKEAKPKKQKQKEGARAVAPAPSSLEAFLRGMQPPLVDPDGAVTCLVVRHQLVLEDTVTLFAEIPDASSRHALLEELGVSAFGARLRIINALASIAASRT